MVGGLTIVASVLAFQNCGPNFELANESLNSSQNQEMLVAGESLVMVDDMLIPKAAFEEMQRTDQISAQGTLPRTLAKWPDGRIPIRIANMRLKRFGSSFSNDSFDGRATESEIAFLRSGLEEACAKWAAVANVRCEINPNVYDRQANAPEPGVVFAYVGAGVCNSAGGSCATLGAPGSSTSTGTLQYPFIAMHRDVLPNPMNKGVFLHEVGHILGFHHEHLRSDRSTYLDFNAAAIPAGVNQSDYSSNGNARDILEFDFASVMGYNIVSPDWDQWKNNTPGYVFAIKREYMANHMRDIVSGGYSFSQWHGYRPAGVPSVGDAQMASAIYGLPRDPKASCRLGDIPVPHGAFVTAYGPSIDSKLKFCESQPRVCDNGTLSGTATSLTCSSGGAPPSTPMNKAPTGNFEEAKTSGLKGWALDPDSGAQSVEVHFYARQTKDAGGNFLFSTVTNVSRPDVNMVKGSTGNHGFQATSGALAGLGGQMVYAYAKDVQTSELVLINAQIVSVDPPPATPTPRPSATPSPTPRASATPTPSPSATPRPSATPTASPSATPRPSATPSPTAPPNVTMCPAGHEFQWVLQDVAKLKSRSTASQGAPAFCRGVTALSAARSQSYTISANNGFTGAIGATCGPNNSVWSINNDLRTCIVLSSSTTGVRSSVVLNMPGLTPQAVVAVRSVWRSFNSGTGDHLFSLDTAEGLNVGYADEGPGFYTLYTANDNGLPSVISPPSTPNGLVRIVRCVNTQAQKHTVRAVACSLHNEAHEGHLGYLFQSQASGQALYGVPASQPLYSCVTGTKVLVTPSQAECANFQTQSVLGYYPSGL